MNTVPHVQFQNKSSKKKGYYLNKEYSLIRSKRTNWRSLPTTAIACEVMPPWHYACPLSCWPLELAESRHGSAGPRGQKFRRGPKSMPPRRVWGLTGSPGKLGTLWEYALTKPLLPLVISFASSTSQILVIASRWKKNRRGDLWKLAIVSRECAFLKGFEWSGFWFYKIKVRIEFFFILSAIRLLSSCWYFVCEGCSS